MSIDHLLFYDSSNSLKLLIVGLASGSFSVTQFRMAQTAFEDFSSASTCWITSADPLFSVYPRSAAKVE